MEAENPLDVLTRDAWYHVISRVKIPEDVIAFANSHTLFRSIITTDLEEEWISTIFYLAFPYFSDYLQKRDVLNLRLVKWIKPIVENYLQQQRILAFNNAPTELRLETYLNTLDRNQNLNALLVKMRRLPITKILRYGVSFRLILGNYLDSINFLQEFGSRVVSLKIDFYYGQSFDLHPIEALKFLKKVLGCVPNIAQLDVTFNCYDFDYGLPFDLWMLDLNNLWSKHHLPALPKLQTVKLDTSCCGHEYTDTCYVTPVYRSFLQAYRKQILNLDTIWVSKSLQILPAMPSLKTLFVVIESEEDVGSLKVLQAPLENIYIRYWNALKPIECKQIFRALENFKNTLIYVHISNLERGKIDKLPDGIYLPQLKRLRITDDLSLKSISYCL